MSIWRFILLIFFIALLALSALSLAAEIIERLWGKSRAKKFTDFVDDISDVLQGLVSFLPF